MENEVELSMRKIYFLLLSVLVISLFFAVYGVINTEYGVRASVFPHIIITICLIIGFSIFLIDHFRKFKGTNTSKVFYLILSVIFLILMIISLIGNIKVFLNS